MPHYLQHIGLSTATLLFCLTNNVPTVRSLVGIKTVSAQETRLSQCNQVIRIANEAVRNAKSITSNETGSEAEAIIRAAEYLDEAAEKMENIALKDPKLKDLQARFVLMYEQTSKASRNFIRAFENQNRTEAELALKTLETATAPEQQLVEEINVYCFDDESYSEGSVVAQIRN